MQGISELEKFRAVSFADIRKVAYPVLRHRILPNFRAEAEGIASETIIAEVLRAIPEDATKR